jgi:uncharacterized protein
MSYKTPGVYIKEISTLPASVAGVETAIPAFIGYTEKAEEDGDLTALRNEPTRITSLLDYIDKFGEARKEEFVLTIDDEYDEEGKLAERNFSAKLKDDTPSSFNLFYSLQLYFSNGGGPCYIVSIGDYDSNQQFGSDNSDLISGIQALEKTDEPTLLVFPDAVNLDDEVKYGGVAKEALNQCHKLKDRFAILDRYDNADGVTLAKFREELGMSYLSYGAVYHPFLKTSLNYRIDEDSEITHNKSGSVPTDPDDLAGEKLKDLEEDEPNIYRSLVAETKKVYVKQPSSGAIAGIYARVDRNRGVWKAPANVSLNSVVAPVEKITDRDQEGLNVDPTTGKSINAIRSFTGKGTLVWGARTLAGNDNEWRYIPVRRLYIFIEQSVKKATEFVVFEPNDANTWVRVRSMIENFLIGLWRDGALAGATPDDAFFVKVGLGETMTSQDILEGRMIVEIGLAAVRPAEFIILRFMHKLQES